MHVFDALLAGTHWLITKIGPSLRVWTSFFCIEMKIIKCTGQNNEFLIGKEPVTTYFDVVFVQPTVQKNDVIL